MKNIRTIIVDDEVLGRSRIRKLLAEHEQIQVVGEGGNGEEALRLISDYRPDLVFLDVEMPGKDGFQVVERIPEAQRPFIVFVTAHSRFALKAFDVKAVDFLLKPFDNERFARALEHAIHQIGLLEQSRLSGQFLRIMDDFRSQAQQTPFIITIRDRGRDKRVNLYDVIYIEADGNYLKLQMEKERILLRQTMQQMTEVLDQSCFLRIHRSVIINVNYLRQRVYKGNNEFGFKLRNGDEFVSGRSFKEAITTFFDAQVA